MSYSQLLCIGPCFDRITEKLSGRRRELEQLQKDDAKVEKRPQEVLAA